MPQARHLEAAKERLDAGHVEVRARHREGAPGRDVVRAITAVADEVVSGLFAALCAEAPGNDVAPLLLAATGGYGRKELAPRSDLDLLAVLPTDARRERAEGIAEKLHRALWDVGFEVGFAARTIDQCVALAREDHTIRTALLDARHVAGDPELWNALERATLTQLDGRAVDGFIQEKVAEVEERRKRYGGSVWLLEPHLKQGKGGLRDLQSALWIARARHGVAGLGETGEKGLLPPREIAAASAARDMLFRLRSELHWATARRDDRLTFENQRKAAAALSYRDQPRELAVEQLMRDTYIALQEIARAADALIDRCAREEAPKARVRKAESRRIDDAFTLRDGRIAVDDREVFVRRPADLVRLYAVAEAYGAPIASAARDLVVRELQRIGPALAADRDAHFELWQLLVREGGDGSGLLPLHELGVLGALFPEVERLRARAQHSLYHVYTVDTHTVFALARLQRLRAGALADEQPELTRIARAQERPLALMLGLLFHDLGKGLGDDHSRRGAELVRGYAQRIGLDPADAEDVEWLVLQHLTMSHLSQRRDLEDRRLIETFAGQVRTVQRLEMLYLLTYADAASVSPENWTDWKARLLKALYEKTKAVLQADGASAPEPAHSVESRRERLAERLGSLAGPLSSQVGAFVRALPERYLGSARPDDAARHLRLWVEAGRTGFAAELHAGSDLTLLAPDRPGLLALFAAALAANGIDVLAADVSSLGDGTALDRFAVREMGGGAPSAERWAAARADLQKLLAGAEDARRLVERRLRRAAWAKGAAPSVATRVRVDDVSSERFTIVDVFAQDRPGLLFAIAEALYEAGVSIEVARVATEGNRAIDAFYLLEASEGHAPGKVRDPDRVARLVSSVEGAIAALAARG